MNYLLPFGCRQPGSNQRSIFPTYHWKWGQGSQIDQLFPSQKAFRMDFVMHAGDTSQPAPHLESWPPCLGWLGQEILLQCVPVFVSRSSTIFTEKSCYLLLFDMILSYFTVQPVLCGGFALGSEFPLAHMTKLTSRQKAIRACF